MFKCLTELVRTLFSIFLLRFLFPVPLWYNTERSRWEHIYTTFGIADDSDVRLPVDLFLFPS